MISDHTPKNSKGDIVHAIVKAAVSSVPLVGNAAAEFLQPLVQPPLEKRRDDWMTDVSERLKKLESEGLTFEKIQQNEKFISTLLQATQISIRTHQQEKREALKNAVLNSARPNSPDDSEQQMFLNFVDIMTEWHIRLLRFFKSPPSVPGLSIGSLSTVLENHNVELRGRREFYDQIWRDLYLRGFVNIEQLNGTLSGNDLIRDRTTQMGAKFLQFISG